MIIRYYSESRVCTGEVVRAAGLHLVVRRTNTEGVCVELITRRQAVEPAEFDRIMAEIGHDPTWGQGSFSAKNTGK